LERDRGTPVTEQIELSGLPNAATKPDAFIWNAGDNNQEDRMLVAWAACEYKSNDWQLRDGWKDLDGARRRGVQRRLQRLQLSTATERSSTGPPTPKKSAPRPSTIPTSPTSC
jgi:hypothetical protein